MTPNRKSNQSGLFLLLLAVTLCLSCGGKAPVVDNRAATPAVRQTPDHKGVKDPKLQSEADRIVPVFKTMPKVAVYVVDEPIRSSDVTIEPGVAYTVCSADNVPIVYVKKAFSSKAPQKQITNILKHELTHAWFCTQGIQTGHDSRFRAKFKEVGGFGN